MSWAGFLIILHVIIVAVFSLRLLLRDDLAPATRLAWFIALVNLPFIGFVLYFLFGEIDLGHHAQQGKILVFQTLKNKATSAFGHVKSGYSHVQPEFQAGFKYISSIHGMHPVSGNRAELLAEDGDAIDRLIADIDAARDHVHVLTYIWLGDGTGTRVAEALIRAANRGVTCRAMADGLGSRTFIGSDLWKAMQAAGVKVAIALSLRQLMRVMFRSRIDLRNHRKIVVVDARVTYCGSQNLADPEFRIKAKYAPWVDIMARFEGPIVAQNQLLFASDWMFETGEDITDLCRVPSETSQGFTAQVMGDGPTVRRGATPQMFDVLIGAARHDLTISTPYFVPDATVLEALCSAAFRGVNVTLIVPRNNDSWVVSAASRSFYKKLLLAGVKIYEFQHGLLHAKTLTIDGCVSLLGSANVDLRSFDLNYENNILLQDKALTSAIKARQQTYIARALLIDLERVNVWPVHRRIWNNVIATIGPIL